MTVKHTTTIDAKIALINSGVLGMVPEDYDLDALAYWMWKTDASPEDVMDLYEDDDLYTDDFDPEIE